MYVPCRLFDLYCADIFSTRICSIAYVGWTTFYNDELIFFSIVSVYMVALICFKYFWLKVRRLYSCASLYLRIFTCLCMCWLFSFIFAAFLFSQIIFFCFFFFLKLLQVIFTIPRRLLISVTHFWSQFKKANKEKLLTLRTCLFKYCFQINIANMANV